MAGGTQNSRPVPDGEGGGIFIYRVMLVIILYMVALVRGRVFLEVHQMLRAYFYLLIIYIRIVRKV